MSGKAKKHALAALDRSIAERRRLLKMALKPRTRRKQPPRYLPEAPLGSLAHDPTRRAAGWIAINVLLDQHARTKGTKTRWFLATFAWDEGIVQANSVEVPLLRPMLHKVYKAVLEFGLSGMIFVDLVIFEPEDGPPYIHIHFHAALHTDDPSFKPSASAAKLSKRRAFRNSRFPAVDFRSRKMAANRFRNKGCHEYEYLFRNLEEKDQTKPSMAWLGYYLTKAPTKVKRVEQSLRRPDQDCIVDAPASENAPKLHLQLERLLQQIPLLSAVAGVGAEPSVSRAFKKRMRAWLKGQSVSRIRSGSKSTSRKKRKRRSA